MTRILVVDDDTKLRKGLAQTASGPTTQVFEAADTKAAIRLIENDYFDVVVTDLSLEGKDDQGGLDILRAAKAKDPYTQVIVVTNYATPKVSVEAIDQGAYDFEERDSPGIDFKGVLHRKIAQAAEYGSLRRRAEKAA